MAHTDTGWTVVPMPFESRRVRALLLLTVLTLGGCGTDTGETAAEKRGEAAQIVQDGGVVAEGDCFEGVCAKDIPTTLTVEEAASYTERFGEAVRMRDEDPVKCHLVAHTIGQAVARGGAGLEGMFEPYGGECTGGYIHGVLQVLGTKPGLADVAVRFGELCEKSGDKLAYIDCIHGYGHALGASMSERRVKEAVGLCDLMREKDRVECVSGVLMQYYQDPNTNTELIDRALCESLENLAYREECGRSLWAVHMSNGASVVEFAAQCTGPLAGACAFGLGYWTRYESDTVEEAMNNCGSYDADLTEGCIEGVVRKEVEMVTDSGAHRDKYRSFCETGGPWRESCLRAEKEALAYMYGTIERN